MSFYLTPNIPIPIRFKPILETLWCKKRYLK